ncbi:hypothetical protein WJ41_35125 [Burkholderia ubonensis]|uniref:hypothetical protein n=1 Tax=Burkholderia ubonensis TaxID=101571 RepID=UPI00075D13ED|nr:hypothetical protein [Burkholderia ubonensis]KVH78744.1 hypothetical protein WJ41_35125 [Burkholderia ubonensis]KVT98636.1 hypothetical protein WK61_09405 [Burkholderia ubonensis]
MATLLECLRALPQAMVIRDLASVRDQDATVAEHIAKLLRDEDGYEVRQEKRNYGRMTNIAVGLVGGPTVYREIF